MAEVMTPDFRRCNHFFLYDGSKVRGEGDPTVAGICYFYPEETPIDKQELLCGQIAGVTRCVSELSSSPVRMLRLRRSKFAIRMKENFLWALSCSVDVPNVSVCQLLDQLINLFCFYNGSVPRSYQINSRETLAVKWAQYLSHLQAGSTELHHIFSCLRTIDGTNIDPLLLLKAALILQACQRCPLVLAGCILFRGRVVSTQMPPDLTVKVMVHETETYSKEQKTNGLNLSGSSGSAPLSSTVTSTSVFLTMAELQCLHSSTVDRESRSHSTPNKGSLQRKARLSRTLSDTPSCGSDQSEPDACSSPISRTSRQQTLSPGSQNSMFRPSPSQSPPGPHSQPPSQTRLQSPKPTCSNGKTSHELEEDLSEDSYYHSFHSNGFEGGQSNVEGDISSHEGASQHNGHTGERRATLTNYGGPELGCQESANEGSQEDHMVFGEVTQKDGLVEDSLVPMTLYQHRVRGLVLALLVEPQFLSNVAAMEEVYHSSLASLNGLEAHLRSTAPGTPGPQGPYVFAHFDCIQNTLTTNMSGRSGGGQERPFVKATSLLHSHFSHTETLQEAIIRRAGAAVFGTRTVAQETYFQQLGGTVRNSGIPNHQDSAFSLPSKARHRMLKHGVNLL